MKDHLHSAFTRIVFISVSLSAAAACAGIFAACSDFEQAVEDIAARSDSTGPADPGHPGTPDAASDEGWPATDEGGQDYGHPHVDFPEDADASTGGGDDSNTASDDGSGGIDAATEDIGAGSVDNGVEPVDPPGCPGYVGCACEQPEDCLSGLCVPTPDAFRCTRMCTTGDDCADEEICRVLNNDQGPDASYACLHRWPTACRPCVDDADCEVAWLDDDAQPACVDGGNNDSFCAPLADGSSLECPEGFSVERLELDRGWSWVCLPDSGQCPCTEAWQRAGYEMNCSITNEFGTCRASRLCNQDCPAAIPAAEACDSLDNNCNGLVDDGINGSECKIVNTIGTCTGHVQCANGIEVCLGTEASTERCDGIDNDCDSMTDEELGMTWCGLGKCSHIVDNCANGHYQICNPLEGAAVESCNGIDDDCDGRTDEDMGQVTCGLGICARTVDKCVGGRLQQCVPHPALQVEKCDDKDNDCDGMTDEGFGVETCGLGPCRHTVDTCADGVPDECDPWEGATMEVCNGFDEDCDGLTDNGIAYAANLMEPNDSLGAAINLGDILENDPTRSFTAMIYPYGDSDYYFFEAVEKDHSCAIGWDQDYKITVTLFNPVGPMDCHGQTLVLYSSSGALLGSDLSAGCLPHTLEYAWDGECGPNDSREFFVKLGTLYENGASCMPYELNITMTKI